VIPVHTRGFQNCDLFFDKVFADDTGHVKSFQYFDRFKQFAEVSDVLCGASGGRENNEERILVYNIGLAIHDIYFAHKIEAMLPKTAQTVLTGALEKLWV
jgi:ornithine cyclodeaminase/alanine dehydrogenase-like protein (mu-crystallin family)